MNLRKIGSLFLIALFGLNLGLAAARAEGGPHFFDPTIVRLGTLRICFKVASLTALPEPQGYEAKLVYTGGEKLDRKVNYPSIRDIELKRVASLDPTNEIVYAFQKGMYVCEIDRVYGAHWVVSPEEVTGD